MELLPVRLPPWASFGQFTPAICWWQETWQSAFRSGHTALQLKVSQGALRENGAPGKTAGQLRWRIWAKPKGAFLKLYWAFYRFLQQPDFLYVLTSPNAEWSSHQTSPVSTAHQPELTDQTPGQFFPKGKWWSPGRVYTLFSSTLTDDGIYITVRLSLLRVDGDMKLVSVFLNHFSSIPTQSPASMSPGNPSFSKGFTLRREEMDVFQERALPL